MDPAAGLDARRDVAITDGRITAVADGGRAGRNTLDATGLVMPDDGGPVYLTGLGDALIRLERKRR